MEYDNIDDLLNDLQDDVNEVSKDKVTKEVEEVLWEESNVIYSEFTPVTYLRRGDENGGYGDKDMISSNVEISDNGINIDVQNNSTTNGDKEMEYLDTIIENGIYSWNRQPPPRPVFNRTLQRLQDENIIQIALKSGLKNRWDIE